MNSLIIYSSLTGFTKKYAFWLAEDLGAKILTLDAAKKKDPAYFTDFDAIVYGGWARAGNIVDAQWFLDRAKGWKDKKLALFCVGASPKERPDVDVAMDQVLSPEEKEYIKVFYCPGGIDYENMSLVNRLAMKAFAAGLRKSKDPDKQEVGIYLAQSYNISEKRHILPIVLYLESH